MIISLIVYLVLLIPDSLLVLSVNTGRLWVLADKRRLHRLRHATMAKTKNTLSKKYSKKKDPFHAKRSEDIPSDSHGSTTPHGYTAWGRTHTGGSSTDDHIIQDMSPPGISKLFFARLKAIKCTWHQTMEPLVTRYLEPVTRYQVISANHQATSHQANDHQAPGHQGIWYQRASVATVREKSLENETFSRSGKSKGSLV